MQRSCSIVVSRERATRIPSFVLPVIKTRPVFFPSFPSLNCLNAAGQRVAIHFAQDHGMAGSGGYLGDAVAHRARADHGDCFDCRGDVVVQRCAETLLVSLGKSARPAFDYLSISSYTIRSTEKAMLWNN